MDVFFAFLEACDLVRIAIEVRKELRADVEGFLMMRSWNALVYRPAGNNETKEQRTDNNAKYFFFILKVDINLLL